MGTSCKKDMGTPKKAMSRWLPCVRDEGRATEDSDRKALAPGEAAH